MSNFFKTFWAALLAFVVGSVVTSLLTFLIFAGMIAAIGSKDPVRVKPNSVLHIDMTSSIVDAPSNMSSVIDLSTFTSTHSNTLLDVLRILEVAEADKNIKGIYINLTGAGSVNVSNVEEIRAAIIRFKENSGKFVVAYNENYSQLGYYLATVADKVIMNPEGYFDWRGLGANVMFYKGLLDKLDIEMEILRHGTFKSAVEPYMSDRMSDANRLQMQTYVDSMWGVLLEDISASRGVSKEKLQEYAATLAVRSAEEAMKLGLVDEVLYEDQVNSVLAALVEGNEPADYASAVDKDMPEAVSLRDYISANAISTKKLSKNKVAVIYAEGSITGGESSRDVVGSTTVAKQLAKARKDKNVKAVVFRVNSPGGSALASEVMWRELELLRAEKPVVVSMGNYAASGGYYISAPADVILADRTTLTGSIGVFGMVPNLQKALKNKLGITIDVVKTGPSADMGMGFRGLSGDERNFFMYQIEQTYSTFVNHVADGRNMTFEEVDAIGQGRVWLGVDAMEIGLIDGFGGIKEAISLAAERAGVSDDFRIYEVVDEKTSINMLLQAAFSARQSALRNELGDAFAEYNHIMQVINEPGVQARMPYTIEVY